MEPSREVNKLPDSVNKAAAPSDPTPQNITVDYLKTFLPRGTSIQVNEEIVAMINRSESETGIDQDLIEEQVLSYSHLLHGRVGFTQLLNAIKFCNLRMMPEMTNEKAYKVVFPGKTREVEARGQSISSFASMYNQTKTVTEIMKLLIVPAYVTYQPLYHAAIKKQFDLMNGIGAKKSDNVSPTVQHLAAAKLADLTKMPEEQSIELKIGMTDDAKNIQQGLMAQIDAFTKVQKAGLDAGKSLSDVQKTGINIDEIIEAEIE